MSNKTPSNSAESEVPDQQAIENSLLEQMKAGNQEAWTQFVRTYTQQLRAMYVRRVRDEDLFDEICQQTFADFFRSLDRFSIGKPVLPYLARIFRNRLFTEWAKKRKRQEHVVQAEQDELQQVVEKIPEEPLFTTEELEAEVASLPDNYRGPIVLQLAGLEREEISELLGLTPGATYVRGNRGRVLLRERLIALLLV